MKLLEKFHRWRRKLRWNRQYKNGRWDSLASPKEAKRYETIIDFIESYGPSSPDILDLGCGNGVLTERMDAEKYAQFKGMDFSKESIKQAVRKDLPRARFEVSDVVTYQPEGFFDIIIFNEVFYYIDNAYKEEVLNRMYAHLKPNGLFIVSIFREGIGCWHYFKEDPRWTERTFTTVKTKEALRYWKVGVYQKK